MSAAVDHGQELAFGGAPRDPRNLSGMHKVCNEAKELARRSMARQANLGVSRQW